MTQGLEKFEYWLIKLDELLLQASRSENPALYLYQKGARTTLYMLESLSKLYEGIYSNDIFTGLKEHFKTLEDLIGAIDYYDSFSKDFSADPSIPASIRIFTEQERDKNTAELNSILLEKKWLDHDPSRTQKIRKKLKEIAWQLPEEEMNLIRKFYETSIADINSFYKSTGNEFTDLELQVHSLRRKLRWLSIYPQALQGSIQLTDNGMQDEAVAKYLTPEIINSSFNKMPLPGNNTTLLMLEKKYFFALSRMISELGKLKDQGLRIIIISEAIKNTGAVSAQAALHQAHALNKMNDEGLTSIMSKAKEFCTAFFEEKNLDKLIAGVSNTA